MLKVCSLAIKLNLLYGSMQVWNHFTKRWTREFARTSVGIWRAVYPTIYLLNLCSLFYVWKLIWVNILVLFARNIIKIILTRKRPKKDQTELFESFLCPILWPIFKGYQNLWFYPFLLNFWPLITRISTKLSFHTMLV